MVERSTLVFCQDAKNLQGAYVVIAFDISDHLMLLIFDIKVDLNNLAAIDVIEVNKYGVLVNLEHEIAPKGLKRYKCPFSERSFVHDRINVNSFFIV